MRTAVLAAFFAAITAPAAYAQEDMERQMAELKRWHENERRAAEQEHRARMEKLDRAFEEKAGALKRGFAEKREKPNPKEGPREGHKEGMRPGGDGIERMIHELAQAVRRLEGQLEEMRGEMNRMRRGGGEERERDMERPREPRRGEPPAPPRPPRRPGEEREEREERDFRFEFREMPERLREFGDDFRKMFREKGFDWERFSDRVPKEFREWGPDKFHEFFKGRQEWFPKEFDRERWFKEFHGWMEKQHPKKDQPDKRKKKMEEDDQDNERTREFI